MAEKVSREKQEEVNAGSLSTKKQRHCSAPEEKTCSERKDKGSQERALSALT